jgi:alpha-glucosidase
MRWHLVPLICWFGLHATGGVAAGGKQAGTTRVVVTSPDGRLRVDVWIEGAGEQASLPRYSVSFRGRPVALPSPMGLDLIDAPSPGDGPVIEGVATRSILETYTQSPGKRSQVLNHCSEAVITFSERVAPARSWEVVVRAYDDGAAFRYRLPAREGGARIEIAGERTGFRLPEDALAYALALEGFTSSHEARYQKRPIADIPADWLLGLPLLVELPGTGWAAIAEAELVDHAGLYLVRDGTRGTTLAARLSPLPGEPKVAVRADLPHESPWRVVMIADKVERLVESDLVLNLNAPRAIGDTSWIRPGKTTFPWWNGFHEGKVPFKMGLNTATARYYIDFCAEAGIPYHSLDGVDNVAWYGGPIVPYEGADITRGIEGLDLREVLRHAATKGVKIRLWRHWKAAETHMDRAFPLYREWGVEGVMLDFMDRDDQQMVRFLRRALETAAANRLTVTLHGVGAPTGLERTYPNLLTSEAVLNLEYDKWDRLGVPPEHELTVPFTRMLAGPLDFHQGSLRGVPVEQFRPRNEAPLVMGTPCRMLASYVVYQNHLPMMADYPSAYRGHPALPVLAKIPATWDDTRCLSGEVGEFIIVARRQGAEWWVGAMTDRKARELEVPLGFLKAGKFDATVYGDRPEAGSGLAEVAAGVGPEGVIRASLVPAGGVLIHLKPSALDPGPCRSDL